MPSFFSAAATDSALGFLVAVGVGDHRSVTHTTLSFTTWPSSMPSRLWRPAVMAARSGVGGAPRSTKMGTTCAPWRYDIALQIPLLWSNAPQNRQGSYDSCLK